MRISEAAAQSGVPAKTIRYWEQRGLLPQPQRTDSGYRVFDAAAIDRLRFVRQAQASGFTLEQIRAVLQVADDGGQTCDHVRALISHQLAVVEERLDQLADARRQLLELAHRAELQDPAACRGYCDIIPADQ